MLEQIKKGLDMPKEPSDLKAKLKKADPQVKDYISELERRNAKLQHQIVKIQADNMERDNRIKALEKELKKHLGQSKLIINTTFAGLDPKLPREQMEKLITEKAKELGYRLEKLAT